MSAIDFDAIFRKTVADHIDSIGGRIRGIVDDMRGQRDIGSEESATKFKRSFLLETLYDELRDITITVNIAQKQRPAPKPAPAGSRFGSHKQDGQMSFDVDEGAEEDEDDTEEQD